MLFCQILCWLSESSCSSLLVQTLVRDQRLVAGAGAAEMHLAKELRKLGESQAGLFVLCICVVCLLFASSRTLIFRPFSALEQYAILKFSEALEVVPRVLLENSGADATSAVASLTAEHQKGNSTAGVNVETGKVCDVVKVRKSASLCLCFGMFSDFQKKGLANL